MEFGRSTESPCLYLYTGFVDNRCKAALPLQISDGNLLSLAKQTAKYFHKFHRKSASSPERFPRKLPPRFL